ncbi:hypothetical protein [Paludisphaera mucosa]|uniref:PEP-CTERM protein-sorting domain-containing protein n=1 Tax=Paludisphaera mucosa TaxID=3030827 RepID=A0ABT6FJZ3_9BACT|nr:hypothetical protein [Paludisphaera mucosa]MDG3007902.1 hypothetical protein [Paludisphaera mucosa]
MKLMRSVSLLSALLAIAWGWGARADVVYSTFGPGGSFDATSGWTIDLGTPGDPTASTQDVAAAFTVTGGDFLLTSFDVALYGPPAPAQDVLTFRIMSNSGPGGAPGTVLETVAATVPELGGVATGVASGSLMLLDGATYFLATDAAASTYRGFWHLSDPPTSGSAAFSFDRAATWSVETEAQPAFRINGRSTGAVPEPGGLTLGGVAALGLIAVHLRRRKAAA